MVPNSTGNEPPESGTGTPCRWWWNWLCQAPRESAGIPCSRCKRCGKVFFEDHATSRRPLLYAAVLARGALPGRELSAAVKCDGQRSSPTLGILPATGGGGAGANGTQR